jgi:aryl-alcohol dehydrogenase-like predicted oxidoreductase
MEYINYNKELKISRIGFGCGPLGNHGWSGLDMKDLISSIQDAIELGINFFDTADCYGLGESEINLSKGLENKRNNVFIATKFGVKIDNNGKSFYDNSYKHLNYSLDSSLKRLKTDYIDLYQIHYHDGIIPIEETLYTLSQKRDEGKIRYFGVTNYLKPIKFENDGFLSFSNEFNMIQKENEILINKILENNSKLLFIAHSVLGQGIFSGKYDTKSKFNENDRRSKSSYNNFHNKLPLILSFFNDLKLNHIIDDPDSLVKLAMKYVLKKIEKSLILVGISARNQLNTFNKIDEFNLTNENIKLIDSLWNKYITNEI